VAKLHLKCAFRTMILYPEKIAEKVIEERKKEFAEEEANK
jgi:hypothetical protein